MCRWFVSAERLVTVSVPRRHLVCDLIARTISLLNWKQQILLSRTWAKTIIVTPANNEMSCH